jgi:hypothetical protein
MLKNEIVQNTDLLQEKQKVLKLLPAELQKYIDPDNSITAIEYPVERFPTKIISIGFDKLPGIEGILSGIKGQYLIFNDNRVLNIRKHNGYFLRVDF